ncbi:MAG: 4Fe-4S dicluster-binding protein [bacterium]
MSFAYGTVAEPATSLGNKTGTWRTFKPVWKHEKCTGCGFCNIYCPDGCVTGEGKGNSSTRTADYDYCKGCGVCAHECPVKDIDMILEVK